MREPLFPDQTKKRQNVIWVFGDQHRAQACGYRGDRNVYTPNLDTLARNGMRFDCAVAGAPWCCPFRGALLTGLYPHQNGVVQTPSALDPNIPTLIRPFQSADYHTAYVGKWHLAGSNAHQHWVKPEQRAGFDHWVGYENNNNQFESYVHGDGIEGVVRLPGYETDALTDLLVDHLSGHVGTAGESGTYQPFFAVLSVQPPHSPYVPPRNPTPGMRRRNPASIEFRPNVPPVAWVRDKAALDLDGYYGMIENLDWNVGRLRDALQRLGIDRETYIVFFSDHGDMVGSHAQWEKSSPWEESIKIPFIISKVGGGQNMRVGQTDAVLNHVDIAPTTLGLCGIPVPDGMVGYDYSRYALGKGMAHYRNEPNPDQEPDSAFLQQIPGKFHGHSVNKPWRGVLMRDGWKYVCMPGNDWLLFNLNDDPYELANLAHDVAFQFQRARCHDRLSRWIHETCDSFALPPRDPDFCRQNPALPQA